MNDNFKSTSTPTYSEVFFLVLGVFVFQIIVGLLIVPFLVRWFGVVATTVLTQVLVIFIPPVLFLWGGRFSPSASLPSAPLDKRGALSGVLLGLSIWLPAMISANLISKLIGQESFSEVSDGIQELIQTTDSRVGVLGTLFAFAVVPGVFEEFLVRGVVLPAFLRKFSAWLAILGSAIFFGVLHQNVPQGTIMIVVGSILGFAVMRSGCLWISMIAHATHNSIILLVTLFTDPKMGEDPATIPLWLAALPLVAILFLWLGFRLLPRRDRWWELPVVGDPIPIVGLQESPLQEPLEDPSGQPPQKD